jgi:hypothetical protein
VQDGKRLFPHRQNRTILLVLRLRFWRGLATRRRRFKMEEMAAKKGKGAKKAKTADTASKPSSVREDLILDAGGYDWGWPAVSMVMANFELSQRLAAGRFNGCGYGTAPTGAPFLTLIGDNLRGMKSALALLKEWTTLSGPSAIRLEIAFDGPGYVLAISQQVDLLRWRVLGIDTVHQPLVVVASHIKRMDSRHPMLEHLADYAKQPVAPLWLMVAEMPEKFTVRGNSREIAFVPNWDNAILLPGIDIYRRLEDRPPDTMARTDAEFRAQTERGPDPGWPPKSEESSAGVAATRERRLAASMPKTLHVLRNTDRGGALLAHALASGCARWAAEQAICNLRSADFLAYQPSGTAKRLAMIDAVRAGALETASMDVDLSTISTDQLETQIGLDAAFLLRRLEPDRAIAGTFGERLQRVKELGYG